MRNFKQRIISVFMTFVMTLSSTVIIAQQATIPVQAAGYGSMHNNNMVWGPQDGYVNLDGVENTNQVDYDLQMIRFSLIRESGDSNNPDGSIAADSKILNNPITCANTDSKVFTYNDSVFEADKILQLVNPTRFEESDREVAHKLNTRRDYTSGSVSGGALAYNLTWVSDNPSDPDSTGHYEVVDDGTGSYFKSSFVSIYDDDSIPELMGSATLRSKYQDNPPSGFESWSTLDNREFFYEYTQAAFIPEEAKAIGVNKPVPDFCLRLLARMAGYGSPYESSSTFDEVFSIYTDYMANGEYVLLCEPMMTFKNAGESSVVNKLFGEGTKYISMTSAEVGMIDDAVSGIMYGYTDSDCMDTEDSAGNNFNFFSGEDSPTHGACKDLFNSLLLQETNWECGLWSLYDEGITNSYKGAKAQFEKNISSSDNFLKGSVTTDDYGNALQQDGNASPGAYWNSIFYYQVYKDIFGSTDYNTSQATSQPVKRFTFRHTQRARQRLCLLNVQYLIMKTVLLSLI